MQGYGMVCYCLEGTVRLDACLLTVKEKVYPYFAASDAVPWSGNQGFSVFRSTMYRWACGTREGDMHRLKGSMLHGEWCCECLVFGEKESRREGVFSVCCIALAISQF